MKKSLSLLFIIIFYVTAALGQSAQAEIARLQSIAILNEQEAMKYAAIARKAEKELMVMRYLAISTELAERSLEIQENDIAALIAIQAYNFYTQYTDSYFNNKLYNSLFDALKRYDLLPKSIITDAEEKYLLTSPKPIFTALLPDSSSSVVADQNGNLRVVTKQGLTVRTLSGHCAQVNQIVFSHSGKLMATSGKDRTIRIWDLKNLNVRPLVIRENDQINKLIFKDNDSYIFYVREDKKVTTQLVPLDLKLMAADLCNVLSKNFTAEEWKIYIATDLPYEQTCSKYTLNNR